MSRQERVDSACLVGILVTLLLLLGSYIPHASAATQQPTTSDGISTAASALIESDTEPVDVPSGIGGMTIAELHQDAATALHSLPQVAPSGQYTGIPEYAASYEGAVPAFPADHFTIESSQHPGVSHVFHMVAALRA